jgi:hypothetical protein
MTTRAVRGWTLSYPIGITARRNEDPEFRCDCTFVKPYLHSLTYWMYHWSGPIATNNDMVRYTEDYNPATNLVECTKYRTCGSIYMRGTSHRNGGFYSYKPEFAHYMAKWQDVDVLGIVRLYDDIIEHEHGYRADTVLTERLWVLWRISAMRISPSRLVKFLEETYQCPVTIINTDQVSDFTVWLQKENIPNLLEAPE